DFHVTGVQTCALPIYPQTYQYFDANGALVFEVVRKPGKKFLQRRPDPGAKDGWTWNLQGVDRVLYRLPELLKADKKNTVFVVEEIGRASCRDRVEIVW